MSCSTLSSTYQQTTSPNSPVLIARGIPDCCYEDTTTANTSYHRYDDPVYKDHWRKPKGTHPHPDPPHPQQNHRTARHTHSPSRTQFEHHQHQPHRTRFDHYHNSTSVPSSPLSMSGVYTTPPSSTHLHPPSYYPFGSSVTQTSSVSSLTSSGGMYAPPSPLPSSQSQLTSSFPSLPPSSHHNHQQQYQPTRQDRYNNTQVFPPSSSEGVAVSQSNRSYLNHLRSNKQHHLTSDWRSESWSGYTSNKHQHGATSSTNNTAFPLSQKLSSSSLGQRVAGGSTTSAGMDLPSPCSEDHSDSSPPSSRMSPYHFSCTYQRPSPNPQSVCYIDITCHPSDRLIEIGDSIQLHCEARILYSNVRPLYQWYKDEEPLINEVDSVFEILRTCKEDLGYYFCVVSNTVDNSQRKSSTACIRVAHGTTPPIDGCVPFILVQPDPTLFIMLGDSLVLKLEVRAQPEPMYQWFKNGNEIHSSNTNELAIKCCTVSDEGTYVCSIKNTFGSILTNSFKVYVSRKRDPLEKRNSANSVNNEHMQPTYTPPPSSPLSWQSLSPTKQIRPRINNVPEEVVKLVTAQVCRQISPGDNIEGVRKGLNISVEDTEAIKLSYASLSDRVHELITTWIKANPYSSVALLENSLQVYGFQIMLPSLSVCQHEPPPSTSQSPPVIIVHPSSVKVNEGDSIELSVEVEGFGFTYQWYKDNLPYPGLIHPTVTLLDVQESSSGLYHCVIHNMFGSVSSKPARVDVVPLKLQLPPSLQGTGRQYYRTPSSYETVGGVFSPPPGSRIPPCGSGDPPPFSPEKKVASAGYNSRERFNSSVSERLENLRVENNSHRPVILEEPISQELVFATELKLRVVCSERHGKPRYLWYFNGLPLPNERQSEFSINSFTDEDVGDYSCEVSNEFGSVMSKKAHISLKPDIEDD